MYCERTPPSMSQDTNYGKFLVLGIVLAAVIFNVAIVSSGAAQSITESDVVENVTLTDDEDRKEVARARASASQSWTSPIEVEVTFRRTQNADHLHIISSSGIEKYIEWEGESVTFTENEVSKGDTITVVAVNEKSKSPNVRTELLTYEVAEPFLESWD